MRLKSVEKNIKVEIGQLKLKDFKEQSAAPAAGADPFRHATPPIGKVHQFCKNMYLKRNHVIFMPFDIQNDLDICFTNNHSLINN